jgi:hypothetical protein
MLIIGCDYHPGFQQIACVDADGGELSERRLDFGTCISTLPRLNTYSSSSCIGTRDRTAKM